MVEQGEIIERLRELAQEKNFLELKNFLSQYSPDDIAEMLDQLDDVELAVSVLDVLPLEDSADILMSIYPEFRTKILKVLPPEKIVKFIEELPSDDGADILDELEEEEVDEVLKLLPDEDEEKLRELSSHPEESAGSLMAHEVEQLPGSYTVAQAIADLVRFGDDIEEIFQIFITDEDGKLLGTVPIQRLLVSSPISRLSDIADRVEIVVPVNADKEQVADMFRRKDVVSAPVVDENGKLLGRITIDDVLDVVDEEASEDLYKMVGIEVEEGEAVHDVRRRIPWLLVAFGGELISGFVLKHFSSTLRQTILLASFIPLIMALGGNVGMQSAAVMIRRITLSRWGHSHHRKAVVKEILSGIMLGLIMGVLLFAIGVFWGEARVGAIAAVSIFAAMTISASVGSTLPVVLSKIGVDPAFATGPFITTFNDVIGLFIYLLIATAMSHML
ncbi:magnesium transporter [bacterium]|nr:magnesium transporter [bacterium]